MCAQFLRYASTICELISAKIRFRSFHTGHPFLDIPGVTQYYWDTRPNVCARKARDTNFPGGGDAMAATMELQIRDDFDPDRIARSGQCFRWQKTGEETWRIVHGAQCLTIRALGGGRFRLSCSKEAYRAHWRPYFDLDEDYRKIRARITAADDPFLHAACAYGKGIRILRQDPWEALASFIISQNKNIPSIKNCITLLCAAAGKPMTDDMGEAYFAFPTPEAILGMSERQLRECRLGYRWSYVRAAALAVAEGALDLPALVSAGEEETLARLTAVPGVGVKVASCVSLFGLHHLDAFPVDVWIKRILANEYPAGYPMERCRPYNGVYQQYMFFYYRDRGAASGQ